MTAPRSIFELMKEPMPDPADKGRWGPWRLDRERLVLVHERERYEVDLETCTSLEEILDWVLHIRAKDWPTEDVGHLVGALDDIFRLYGRRKLTEADARKRIQRIREPEPTGWLSGLL